MNILLFIHSAVDGHLYCFSSLSLSQRLLLGIFLFIRPVHMCTNFYSPRSGISGCFPELLYNSYGPSSIFWNSWCSTSLPMLNIISFLGTVLPLGILKFLVPAPSFFVLDVRLWAEVFRYLCCRTLTQSTQTLLPTPTPHIHTSGSIQLPEPFESRDSLNSERAPESVLLHLTAAALWGRGRGRGRGRGMDQVESSPPPNLGAPILTYYHYSK